MADVFSRKKRSEIMGRIGSENTKPEIGLRKALHQLGYRFRLHVKDLPGKPDIVLPRYRTAVQVRGCFWHSHSCIDGHIPKTRRAYWEPKLRANQQRDARNDRALRKQRWSVIVVWECKIASRIGLEREAKRICRVLDANRAKRSG
jgi:DNA mismatch endonuclease (patch repair protein)